MSKEIDSEELRHGLVWLLLGNRKPQGAAIVVNTWLGRILPEIYRDTYFPSRDYRRFSGLYGLFNGNELVYIGRSTNIIARLRWHFINKSGAQMKHRRPFNGAAFIEVGLSIKDLDFIEKQLILAIQPRGNRRPKYLSSKC
jgi:hypothetical protein